MRTRSFLFCPANRPGRFSKAVAAGADWVVLDLEDGVPANERMMARQIVCSYLSDTGGNASGFALRINSLATIDGILDAGMLIDMDVWPGMIVIPKIETSKELSQIQALAEAKGKAPALMATLESTRALADVRQILRDFQTVRVVAYGSGDHTAETGAAMTETGLAWGRGQIVNAAAEAGVPAVDGVCLDFRNDAALAREARLAREMGFAGKIAIHPGQVAGINDVFTPSPEEIDRARKMVAAFTAAGGGAFSFEGKMIDRPVLANARRILAAADV